ncbi:hypothetical protein RHECNPAF_122100124 [Rhizobium etli CNPAF512]|nr:hypothetical protein RHECNPAF_122100124 [Rhizobium etli CNPAF512]
MLGFITQPITTDWIAIATRAGQGNIFVSPFEEPERGRAAASCNSGLCGLNVVT